MDLTHRRCGRFWEIIDLKKNRFRFNSMHLQSCVSSQERDPSLLSSHPPISMKTLLAFQEAHFTEPLITFKICYCWVTLTRQETEFYPDTRVCSWYRFVNWVPGKYLALDLSFNRRMAASLWMMLLCLLMHGSFCSEWPIQKGCMKWSSDETNDKNVCCDICHPGE